MVCSVLATPGCRAQTALPMLSGSRTPNPPSPVSASVSASPIPSFATPAPAALSSLSMVVAFCALSVAASVSWSLRIAASSPVASVAIAAVAPASVTPSFSPARVPVSPRPLSLWFCLSFVCRRSARRPDIPLRSNFHRVRSSCASLRWRQPKRTCYGVFLRFLDLAYFFLALSFSSLLLGFASVRRRRVGFGVPVQIFAFLPSSDRRFKAVAEVVFAVRRVGDFVPAEVDAASGARLADAGQQVHGDDGAEWLYQRNQLRLPD